MKPHVVSEKISAEVWLSALPNKDIGVQLLIGHDSIDDCDLTFDQLLKNIDSFEWEPEELAQFKSKLVRRLKAFLKKLEA